LDIKEAIVKRRSVRAFSEVAPDKSLVLEILDVARWAPTHCNTQAVKFIIIDDAELKQKIVGMGGSVIIKNAPIGILVSYSNLSDNIEYLDYIQSASAVIQNVLLYSYSKGLATCWVAHLPRKSDLQKLFNIPQTYDPIAYILMGYPKKEPKEVPRKYKIEEITGYNNTTVDSASQKTRRDMIQIKSKLRKAYYKLPTPIKRLLNPIVDRLFVNKFEN